MERSDAELLLKLVGKRYRTESWDVRLQKPVPKGLHQWADQKVSLANLIVERLADGCIRHLLITAWSNRDDWYVVVFPEQRSRPLAELHALDPGADESVLSWRYQPMKRDGRNAERRAYFEEQFGGLTVHVGFPRERAQLEGFLEDMFALVDNRLAADALEVNRPSNDERFPEGRLVERRHLARERNAALVARVKASRAGRLHCDVCGFDFEKVYGRHGSGFIEAHHTVPVSELRENSVTRPEDIALVCSNCHRMLHRRRPWLGMKDLGAILAAAPKRRR